MARRGDTRSPSPVGSSYSSSRRSRRDDDRHERSRRDDGRSYRRSRSPERRYRDRDHGRDRDGYRRRDAPLDRRDDDNTYRPGAGRRRSRERDFDRDYRRRSRDRDFRSRRDDSRDRNRRHTDDSADLNPKLKRPSSRDRESKSGTPAPAPAGPPDAEKQAERLAKIAAWKQKLEDKKNQEDASAPKNILDAIARKAVSSPAIDSSPAPASDSFLVVNSSPSSNALPATPSAHAPVTPSALFPLTTPFNFTPSVKKMPAARLKAFESSSEEKPLRNKLGMPKGPNLSPDDGKYNVGDDTGDDLQFDMQSEEDAAAAIRAAAENRAPRSVPQIALQEPAVASDAAIAPAGTTQMDVDEEEVDPLDAYMATLTDSVANESPTRKRDITGGTKKTETQPQLMHGEDDHITAVGEEDADDVLAMAKKKKKKEVPTVDHATIDYEPFRKDFYMPPSHLAELTPDDVQNLRHELDGIRVRGSDVPIPVSKWSHCGLGIQFMNVLERLGYDGLTSIQAQAIPAIMSGRDVIGIAKTGSGKTMAFLVPMFRHIKDQRPLRNMEGPIGLIMTPTRELATQIRKDCTPFLKALGLRAVCAYGGAPIKDQIAELKRGAEIVVCTPGRMIDLLAANSGRVLNLKRVTYMVLDEADRMFDMGFEPQVTKILANIRPDRQTVLFSATFPRTMEALARRTLKNPVEITVGGRSVVAPEITQIVEVMDENDKFVRLLQLLGELYNDDANEDARALVFVDRQEAADTLLKELMLKGYPCMSIHGGKDQIDRDSTIEDFKAGIFPVLIATSVAARGLDVKQLKLVVNFDAPNHLEDYVHRAGRTGRAGNTGTAVTFLTETQERYATDIAKALKQSGQEIPEPVQKLVNAFYEKVSAGQEKKASGAGFGGKGLERLDQERESARNRERRTYKTSEDNDDDENYDEDKDDKDQERFSKALSQVQSAAAPPPELVGVPKGIDLDGQITVHKTERDPNAGSKDTLDKVDSAVANIHARLSRAGVMRSGVPIDNRGPDAGAFHATMEINDFPQKARWAVTNRTNVAKILENSGTSITTKGNFYGAGKEPGPNDLPKLYILVEGETEISVTNAMRELMRLLKEGTIAAAESDARAPASGRYNVL